ncbi:MAG: tryptophan synthase subunit alpha [Candidatus Obscuribacterales bacterium]|nr:tryptophan synthase subunit alpha [Candidatus Obscuribacterales bacterium]
MPETLSTDRYNERFVKLKADKKKAFMPFTMLGWPNRDTCLKTIKTMIQSGATALELGIAFSDPLADGPTIQQAAIETIASGFNVADAFDLIAEARSFDAHIPIGLMVYYNMVLKYGPEAFYAKAKESGVDGILIVDLPPEESSNITGLAKQNKLAQIFIVSPLTTSKRLELILKQASGFLYVVSRLGITGVHEDFDQKLQELLFTVKKSTNLPLLVGFGISTPEHAQRMLSLGADGVITGSRVIDLVRKSPDDEKALLNYLASMVEANSV